jgi:hypothetical protein
MAAATPREEFRKRRRVGRDMSVLLSSIGLRFYTTRARAFKQLFAPGHEPSHAYRDDAIA